MLNDGAALRWWQTLPGKIAALTAIVTSLGGLVVAVKSSGLIELLIVKTQHPVATCDKLPRPGNLAAKETFKDCTCCPEMIVLPDGSAMSKYETTRKEYSDYIVARGNDKPDGDSGCYLYKVMGNKGIWQQDSNASWRNPSFKQDDDEPVVCISWNDAKSYVRWLSDITGAEYMLPETKDMKYAANISGVSQVFWSGDEIPCKFANINDQQSQQFNAFSWPSMGCNDGYPHPTSRGLHQTAGKSANFMPNALGIYHLIGNVYEWLSSDDGCTVAGQTSIWGGSWTAAPDKAIAAPGWCQSREFKAMDIGMRVITKP